MRFVFIGLFIFGTALFRASSLQEGIVFPPILKGQGLMFRSPQLNYRCLTKKVHGNRGELTCVQVWSSASCTEAIVESAQGKRSCEMCRTVLNFVVRLPDYVPQMCIAWRFSIVYVHMISLGLDAVTAWVIGKAWNLVLGAGCNNILFQ